MKIKKDMYVKTGEGYIGKIIDIDNAVWNPITIDTKIDLRRHDHYPKSWLFLKKDNIKKASFNIIDLIEDGDYINGRLYYKERNEIWDEELGWMMFDEIEESQIKSIVTHEQFESMSYKIGE